VRKLNQWQALLIELSTICCKECCLGVDGEDVVAMAATVKVRAGHRNAIFQWALKTRYKVVVSITNKYLFPTLVYA
jgi:hypothetical protein